jgi:hypothetical protein
MGTLWQWPHTMPSPTNKQKQTNTSKACFRLLFFGLTFWIKLVVLKFVGEIDIFPASDDFQLFSTKLAFLPNWKIQI